MAGWFAHTLRPAMLAAGRSDRLGRIVERSPLTRGVVRRFVPGDTLDDVVDIVTALRDSGRYLSIDYLGENVTPDKAPAADVNEQHRRPVADIGNRDAALMVAQQVGLPGPRRR